MKFIFTLTFIFSVTYMCFRTSHASVWTDKNQWSTEYEVKYSNWVKNSIDKKFFYRKGTLLYRFPTDCADALYAFRVQFAYENDLPFAMSHPKKEGLLTNLTNDFDYILNEKRRVRAFIEFISQEAGTLNLQYDTFPLNILHLRVGDIYATKWYFLGESARHSSLVISINNKKGHINFLSSNAPRKLRKLLYSPRSPDFTFESRPWGYRRWKWPRDYQVTNSQINSSRGYSEMQYELLHRYGPSRVQRKIKEIIKSRY